MINLNDIHMWCDEKFGPCELIGNWRSVWEYEIRDIDDQNYLYHEFISSTLSRYKIKFSFVNKEDAVLFRLTWG